MYDMPDCPRCKEHIDYWNLIGEFICPHCGKYHQPVKNLKEDAKMPSNCVLATYDCHNDDYICSAKLGGGICGCIKYPDSTKCHIYKDWEKKERDRMDALKKVDVRLSINSPENMSNIVLALSQSGYKIGVKSKEDTGGFDIEIEGVELMSSKAEKVMDMNSSALNTL